MHPGQVIQLMDDVTGYSPITLRALLPSRKAGALIGIQRKIQFKIQEEHGVRLYFHSEMDDFGRLTSVAGKLENVARTWRKAMVLLFSFNQHLNYGEVMQCDSLRTR